MERAVDSATHPVTAVTTSGSVLTANIAGMGVPDFINWATAIYLTMLIGHKGYSIYCEWKKGKLNDSDE